MNPFIKLFLSQTCEIASAIQMPASCSCVRALLLPGRNTKELPFPHPSLFSKDSMTSSIAFPASTGPFQSFCSTGTGERSIRSQKKLRFHRKNGILPTIQWHTTGVHE